MMRNLRPLWTAALMAGALVSTPLVASALDTPLMHPVQSKPGSVKLMVYAGGSGAPDGFEVQWVTRSDFEANGWSSSSSSFVEGSFQGVPTFNTDGDANSYILAPAEGIEVELGQLFDETGVASNDVSELEPATEYVVRIRAKGVAPSEYTEALGVSTTPLAENCTYTIGYWKNHFEAWPVAGLTLGTVAYTSAELLAILNQPAGGNGLIILAHQLIAAKLNIANGADPTAAAASIAAADAQIGGLIVPPIGGGFLAPASVSALSNTLDDFNNGLIGPGHCGSTPASAATWGQMKAMYRQ